ncbi:hypothetical protein RclHR1_06200004 [Rhizophagus clarus]|uniref:Uncharacterized protein n=1 Tax=Rhizophagus clarus TaxID=94130 RepID=A0A2Z6SI64_9GLOM|nr:hypothetical protein RclHR1_06200004 [Rhizophagus clarus]GES85482.1 hypothetical protein GLOIN_2v1560768 [Rhizophagus clarus]
MICSNKPKIAKRIFQREINNIKRYYASTIQLPFHPHYVPPGQPSAITTASSIRKQNKTSRFDRLQEASFSKREDIFLSMNFFGDTYNEPSKRKIPFLFRISTICFVAASLIRFYHRGIKGSKGNKGNKGSNNKINNQNPS